MDGVTRARAAGDPTADRRLARFIEWEVAAMATRLNFPAVLTIATSLPSVA